MYTLNSYGYFTSSVCVYAESGRSENGRRPALASNVTFLQPESTNDNMHYKIQQWGREGRERQLHSRVAIWLRRGGDAVVPRGVDELLHVCCTKSAEVPQIDLSHIHAIRVVGNSRRHILLT